MKIIVQRILNLNDLERIIYGKSDLSNIVNIEVSDGYAEVTQLIDNKLVTNEIPNKTWILSNYKLKPDMIRLKGDLHYKWGKQFDNKEDFYHFKRVFKYSDLFTVNTPSENCMINKGMTYYKGLDIPEVPVLSFDLETTSLKHNENAKILLISNTYRDAKGIVKKLFAYDDYASQADMLITWCRWVVKINPMVVLGHNLNGFDIPYLLYIAEQEGIELLLGRDGSPLTQSKFESKYRVDGTKDLHYHKHKIYGREIIDTLFLAYKYDIGRKYESYGLKNIIKQEGLEKANRTFYDASTIRFNYQDPKQWDLIKRYCIDDSDDSLALWDLMVPPFFYLARSIPKSFQAIIESASGSQLNSIMLRSYLQDAHSLPQTSEAQPFEGAVSDGFPGIYSNVFKIDVASLYPNIMLQYEIYDKEKDPQKNLLKILKSFTDERLKNKKLAKETNDLKFKHLEQSQKIVINSVYGFLGSRGLLFNSPSNAALVTSHGRDIIKKTVLWATGKEYIERVEEND